MVSSSYSNLLDLATGAADQGPAPAALGALRRRLPSVVTTPGLMEDSPASPSTPSPAPRRVARLHAGAAPATTAPPSGPLVAGRCLLPRRRR